MFSAAFWLAETTEGIQWASKSPQGEYARLPLLRTSSKAMMTLLSESGYFSVSARFLTAQSLPRLEEFWMPSLKATTLGWFLRAASDRLAILSVNCSLTLVDKFTNVSGCCDVTCPNRSSLGLFKYPFKTTTWFFFFFPTFQDILVAHSYLWGDLFHGVNKVVYLRVQPGTLQNHSLQLFDGRCHIFIWETKKDLKTDART